MVVNIYLTSAGFLASRVDESTVHRLGDAISYKDKRYVVVAIDNREHIDYQTVVKINSLVEKPEEAEIDEVTIIDKIE